MNKLTKEKAVAALYESDHAFLHKKFGEELCEAFGVKPMPVQKQKVNPGSFKGLKVKGKKAGDTVFGYDARDLADHIALALDPRFSNPCFGRGSGLRVAVAHIEKTLGIKGAS